MKKSKLSIVFVLCLVNSIDAQVERPVKTELKKEPNLKTIKKLTVNNPPVNDLPANNTLYYLTSAKVTITTGNDNKEQPSRVVISVSRTGGGEWPSEEKGGGCHLYGFNYSTDIRNEYKINSVTDIELKTSFQFPGSIPGGYGEGWRYRNLRLDLIQLEGLVLYIFYTPNFLLDAWKIENVKLKLEFKDINGNPHPSMGSMIIDFITASTLMTGANGKFIMRTNKFLQALN